MLLNLEPVRHPGQSPAHTPLAGSEAHRREVVGRLLAEGLSAEVLMRLLPEWRTLIRSVAEEREAAGGRDAADTG